MRTTNDINAEKPTGGAEKIRRVISLVLLVVISYHIGLTRARSEKSISEYGAVKAQYDRIEAQYSALKAEYDIVDKQCSVTRTQ